MTFNFFSLLSWWKIPSDIFPSEGRLSQCNGPMRPQTQKIDSSLVHNELALLFKHSALWAVMMDVSTNANVTFQALSSLVNQAHLVVLLCQRCTLSDSPPSRLSADPLVLPSAEVAGGWKHRNWDQSLSHCHYQFCPDNWSAFFFYFHPSNVGGRVGRRGGSGESEGWRTWKRAPFFPFLQWRNVVSYLVRAWVFAKKILMLSSQPLLHVYDTSKVHIFYYLWTPREIMKIVMKAAL